MALVFAGATERFEREHRGRAWQSWHTAALPRLKDFPDLETLMGIKRTPKVQTPEEMRSVFASMRAKAARAQ